mmetsp:Transcript_15523/g.17901  ORF Transcript_15523/g.17901 Transcript_15523/m.17901 type:complete len:650 (-) Transcript_15523:332-2281(-)
MMPQQRQQEHQQKERQRHKYPPDSMISPLFLFYIFFILFAINTKVAFADADADADDSTSTLPVKAKYLTNDSRTSNDEKFTNFQVVTIPEFTLVFSPIPEDKSNWNPEQKNEIRNIAKDVLASYLPIQLTTAGGEESCHYQGSNLVFSSSTAVSTTASSSVSRSEGEDEEDSAEESLSSELLPGNDNNEDNIMQRKGRNPNRRTSDNWAGTEALVLKGFVSFSGDATPTLYDLNQWTKEATESVLLEELQNTDEFGYIQTVGYTSSKIITQYPSSAPLPVQKTPPKSTSQVISGPTESSTLNANPPLSAGLIGGVIGACIMSIIVVFFVYRHRSSSRRITSSFDSDENIMNKELREISIMDVREDDLDTENMDEIDKEIIAEIIAASPERLGSTDDEIDEEHLTELQQQQGEKADNVANSSTTSSYTWFSGYFSASTKQQKDQLQDAKLKRFFLWPTESFERDRQVSPLKKDMMQAPWAVSSGGVINNDAASRTTYDLYYPSNGATASDSVLQPSHFLAATDSPQRQSSEDDIRMKNNNPNSYLNGRNLNNVLASSNSSLDDPNSTNGGRFTLTSWDADSTWNPDDAEITLLTEGSEEMAPHFVLDKNNNNIENDNIDADEERIADYKQRRRACRLTPPSQIRKSRKYY